MAFRYSVRLSRRNVSVRAGFGLVSAARSSEASSEATNLRRPPTRGILMCAKLPDDLLPQLGVFAHSLVYDHRQSRSRS